MSRGSGRRGDQMMMWLIILFQTTAMLLLAFRDGQADRQTLYLAGLMPLVTLIVLNRLPAMWEIDRTILSLVMFLCSLSVVALTAVAEEKNAAMTQAIYLLGGLLVMMAAIVFVRRVKKWKSWNWIMILVSFGLLITPLVIGTVLNGAKNWIVFKRGGVVVFSLQPSEFVKASLIFILASMLSGQKRLKETIWPVLISIGMCGVLLFQKDLGALLLYFFVTLVLYFLATSNWFLSLMGLIAGAGGSVVAYFIFDYVKTRIAVWINPWIDPDDKGFQIIQALVAIGSGGWLGMGLGMGGSGDIPLNSSDFIYAAICEEFGWIFALLLLTVYGIIVLRGISIAMNARNSFHALLAFGVITMLGLQTLLIVGGNIRLLPLTGVVLPFVAAGGSSVISCMIQIGLLLGVSSLNAEADKEDMERAKWREGGWR